MEVINICMLHCLECDTPKLYVFCDRKSACVFCLLQCEFLFIVEKPQKLFKDDILPSL